MLAFTLTAFLELMDHGIVSWDMVSITFIKQVRPSTLSLSPPSPCQLSGREGKSRCCSMQSLAGMSLVFPGAGFFILSNDLSRTPERFTL